jgi:TolB-like protein
MIKNVFISYRRKGVGSPLAQAIKAKIENLDRDLHVFLDVDDLPSGHFGPNLIEAISSCDYFIPIITEDYLHFHDLESDWVVKEIKMALDKGKTIIPIFNGAITWPILPEIISGLKASHSLSYYHDHSNSTIQQLAKRIGIEFPSKKRRSRWLYPSIVMIVISILTAGYIFWISNPKIMLSSSIDSLTTKDISKFNNSRAPSELRKIKPIRLAVLPFSYNGSKESYKDLVNGFAQMMISSLQSTESIQILERVDLVKVTNELSLQNKATIDQTTAVQIGKLIGANRIILGSFFEIMGQFRVDAKLICVETGEILASYGKTGKASEFVRMSEDLAKSIQIQLRGIR